MTTAVTKLVAKALIPNANLTAHGYFDAMAIRTRKKNLWTRFIGPTATLMILGYFGFHALNGQYGIRAHLAMQSQIATLEQDLETQTKKREKLEARVKLLQDGSLEKDMVDRWVRAQLNMTRADEIVILRH